MRERQLLFVTYYDKNFDEGLPYAIYLTRILKKGMTILLIYKKKMIEGFENLMSAITFAEANEHETARHILAEGKVRDKKIASLLEKCDTAGIDTEVSAEKSDAISAIKKFLRHESSIDMVLLNPNITDNGNIKEKELDRLVRAASVPVVTIEKDECDNHKVTQRKYLRKERD